MKPRIPLLSDTGETVDMEITTEIVEQARKLSYRHDAYFMLDRSTLILPISDLVWKRARPEGIKNAIDRMSRAFQGTHPKRRPVKVEHTANGRYLLADGNSTALVASAAGWPDIPCEMVEK
jgi:hypothetical protein